jgi:hypothetical protein
MGLKPWAKFFSPFVGAIEFPPFLTEPFSQILQNAQESIQLNSVGENYHDLKSALDKTEPGEGLLRDHLANISKPVTKPAWEFPRLRPGRLLVKI